MDEIISQVLAKIQQRQSQSCEITYSSQAVPPDDHVFTDNATVDLQNVAIPLVTELYRMKTDNPWVAWLLEGLSYQVRFNVHVTGLMINFIPRKMVLDWPLLFIVDEDQPIVALRNHLISRQDVATLPDHSVLILTAQQRVTAEAEETLRVKGMTLKMRTDEDCIWQK